MKQAFSYRWVMIIGICICFACRGSEGPLGVSGEDYSSLLDPAIQPRVIFTDPQNQSIGPYDVYNSIQVRFNKIMDAGSMRRAISFSADSQHVVLDTTRVTMERGDVVTISAIDSPSLGSFRWRIGRSYSMAISTEAIDVNGNHLTEPCTVRFVPEPHFRVTSVSPKDGAINVKVGSLPRINLNSPADSRIISMASFIPTTGGSWSLSADGLSMSFRVRIVNSKNLDIGTEYHLSLDSSAQDRFGNHLLSGFSSSFSTIPFRVSASAPRDGAIDISRTFQVRLTFTAPVDTSTIREAIDVQPHADFFIAYSSARKAVYLSPSSSWPPLSFCTIRVDSSLRSATGKSLARPFVLRFTTGE